MTAQMTELVSKINQLKKKVEEQVQGAEAFADEVEELRGAHRLERLERVLAGRHAPARVPREAPRL